MRTQLRPTNAGGPGSWTSAIERAGTGTVSGPPDLARGQIGLPEPARQKLARLRAADEDLSAARRALADTRAGLISRREGAAARIRQLEKPGSSARFFGLEKHPGFVEATTERDAAVAEIAEIDRRIADLRARAPRVLAGIDRYLASLPHSVAASPHAEPVTPKKGATVESVRARIDQLRADLHEVRSAPTPSGVVKAAIRAEVARRAEQSAPLVNRVIEGAPADSIWPVATTRATINAFAQVEGAPQVSGIAQSSAPDTFGLLCWLFHDDLIRRLDTEVDEMSDDAAALSDDERADREAAILGQILELERIEVAIVDASGDGHYRPDTDPRAVLGLSAEMPPPRES